MGTIEREEEEGIASVGREKKGRTPPKKGVKWKLIGGDDRGGFIKEIKGCLAVPNFIVSLLLRTWVSSCPTPTTIYCYKPHILQLWTIKSYVATLLVIAVCVWPLFANFLLHFSSQDDSLPTSDPHKPALPTTNKKGGSSLPPHSFHGPSFFFHSETHNSIGWERRAE